MIDFSRILEILLNIDSNRIFAASISRGFGGIAGKTQIKARSQCILRKMIPKSEEITYHGKIIFEFKYLSTFMTIDENVQ